MKFYKYAHTSETIKLTDIHMFVRLQVVIISQRNPQIHARIHLKPSFNTIHTIKGTPYIEAQRKCLKKSRIKFF